MDQDSPGEPHIVTLELPQEVWEQLQACMEALDHDEPEQTVKLMVNILVLAIALTSKENPMVYLYTRKNYKSGFTHVYCPDCKKELPLMNQVSDGFRETGFKLKR